MDNDLSLGETPKSKLKRSAKPSPSSSGSSRRRVYHCLASPQGFLRDHSQDLISDQSPLWTDSAADSLRFLAHDVAAARLQQLQRFIPDLAISLVSFQYAPSGVWTPADD